MHQAAEAATHGHGLAHVFDELDAAELGTGVLAPGSGTVA